MRQALAPFAGELSHAGKLAATPLPALAPKSLALGQSARSAAVANIAGERPPTPAAPLDGSAASSERQRTRASASPAISQTPLSAPAAFGTSDDLPRRSNVPATLPPDDEPPGKGSTQQDASPLDIGRGSTEQAPPIVLPPAVSSGPWPPLGPTQLPRRRRSRTLVGVLAVLLGAMVTGAIVAGVVIYRQNELDDEPGPSTLPPPETTLTPIAPPAGDAGAPPPLVTTPPTVTTPRTPSAPRDAGASPAPGIPPFVFPSALPSTLPGLPSGFPTAIPTEFPTTLPPLFPAPNQQPDGG
jgi:hypothetical protein